MDADLIRRMEECGVVVRRFRPPKPYAIRRGNNRTHRKVLVVDGRVGLTGGVGIAEEWTGDAQDPDHWRDTHVRVHGPVVRSLQGAFAENWLEATGEVLAGEDDLPKLDPLPDGDAAMQVIRSSAGVGDTNVETLYYLAIASARRRVDLTSAYFAPRPAFLKALVDAVARGVDVRVLVPGEHIDKDVVRHAGRSVYGELLRGGVRVFEYLPTMLHAKSMMVDDVWSAVGSANFDNRSFQLNDEAVLCVQDPGLAALLSERFEADLADSEEITLETWRGRPATERIREVGGRLLRREL
jgi:cardiolipin synthase